MKPLSRRDVLVGTAAAGALASTGCGPELIAQLSPGFPLGVASGEVTFDSAVLWTRYLGEQRLRLTVFEDTAGEVVFDDEVQPADGGFVHARVSLPIPGERYVFRFAEGEGGAQTIEGAFRAAPLPGAMEPLVFSASACARNGYDFSVLGRLAERQDLALHLLLGDTTYNDGARTIAEYRAKWSENLARPEYRQLRARTSVLATWDDHEISNDWTGSDMDPELLRNGTASFFEHMPLSRLDGAPDRLWRSVRWGSTAEFFLIDGRSERKAGVEYLSDEQFTWLESALASSPARFKILMNSVPITEFPGGYRIFKRDRWQGYPAHRERLLRSIEDRGLRGVFFVSGDFHMGSISWASATGPGSRTLEVLTGPIATRSPNPGVNVLHPPQFQFATVEWNATVFHLDPTRGEVNVAWITADGRTLAEQRFRP